MFSNITIMHCRLAEKWIFEFERLGKGRKNLLELKGLIKNRGAVPVLGTGFSRQLNPIVPLWGELADLCEEILVNKFGFRGRIIKGVSRILWAKNPIAELAELKREMESRGEETRNTIVDDAFVNSYIKPFLIKASTNGWEGVDRVMMFLAERKPSTFAPSLEKSVQDPARTQRRFKKELGKVLGGNTCGSVERVMRFLAAKAPALFYPRSCLQLFINDFKQELVLRDVSDRLSVEGVMALLKKRTFFKEVMKEERKTEEHLLFARELVNVALAPLQVINKEAAIYVEAMCMELPILTVNFDLLTEEAIGRVPLLLSDANREGYFKALGDGTNALHKNYVCHLHGHIHDRSGVGGYSFLPCEYEETTPAFLEAMSNVVEEGGMSLFFIGASGTVVDRHFKALWEKLANWRTEVKCFLIHHGSFKSSLVAHRMRAQVSILSKGHADLRLIPYGSPDSPYDHSDLLPLLKELAPDGAYEEAVKRMRRAAGKQEISLSLLNSLKAASMPILLDPGRPDLQAALSAAMASSDLTTDQKIFIVKYGADALAEEILAGFAPVKLKNKFKEKVETALLEATSEVTFLGPVQKEFMPLLERHESLSESQLENALFNAMASTTLSTEQEAFLHRDDGVGAEALAEEIVAPFYPPELKNELKKKVKSALLQEGVREEKSPAVSE